MKYNKQPISIDDQITILKGRGLIFDDEQNAHSVLENISYFRQSPEYICAGIQISSDKISKCATCHDGLPSWMGE